LLSVWGAFANRVGYVSFTTTISECGRHRWLFQ
jgi:hypothetical protein